ncbi:MAG: phage tail assembly protein [Methanosarcina sp.]|uniref:phage tail assembly protein n=1 Tax=Methanosarcina sp. TaxID=2213 RepID=UPI002637F27D|nr:phage tail assembly protein [Methanosarcina sp.]MDD3246399.1 phage tail assembly protein [Methanosarcina sp.]MDD4248313.1 phage tail assembly protein [Methanosarcina sp.]
MTFQTEFEFTLPKGYVDGEGNLQKKGIMRLATAADEILPLKDPRVQGNPAYLTVILLSRVITKLGGLQIISTKVIEDLFASDLAYLQDFYGRINDSSSASIRAICPKCGNDFEVEEYSPGE